MGVRWDSSNKNAEFSQLVSVKRIFSGKCLKFVQVVLRYKFYNLDVKYLKPISNEVRNLSVEKITLEGMYQKTRNKEFLITS